MYEEYRYCKDIKPGLTHDQFIDEPTGVIAWLLQIDNTVTEVRNEAQRKANGR